MVFRCAVKSKFLTGFIKSQLVGVSYLSCRPTPARLAKRNVMAFWFRRRLRIFSGSQPRQDWYIGLARQGHVRHSQARGRGDHGWTGGDWRVMDE
jgi:hypothetical protein